MTQHTDITGTDRIKTAVPAGAAVSAKRRDRVRRTYGSRLPEGLLYDRSAKRKDEYGNFYWRRCSDCHTI